MNADNKVLIRCKTCGGKFWDRCFVLSASTKDDKTVQVTPATVWVCKRCGNVLSLADYMGEHS